MQPPKKPKYADIIASIDPQIIASWSAIQESIKASLVFEVPADFNPKFIAGADISFSQQYPLFGAATVAVLRPDMSLVCLKTLILKIDVPYVPGFLAFREVDGIKRTYELCVQKCAETIDDFNHIGLVFVDGNGLLHPRQCGLACHLGAVLKVPTVGCAKTIFAIDGINKFTVEKIKQEFKTEGEVKGVTRELTGTSGKVWGVAVKNSKKAYDPLIVSPGNMVDFKTAVDITIKCSKKRVVEPIRIADHHSRWIIGKWDKFYEGALKNGLVEGDILKQFQLKIDNDFDDVSFYSKK